MLNRLFQELFSKNKPTNTHPKTGMGTSFPDTQKKDLKSIIESSEKTAKTASLSPENEKRMTDISSYFPPITGKTGLNIFVFHVSGAKKTKLDFKDIKIDLSQFDYNELLKTFIQAIQKARADAQIILVTQNGSELINLSQPGVQVIELPLNSEFPMYERVVAMCSYVHSEAFTTNTVFLDSDAFLTKDPSPVFDAAFDIALTFRDAPGLMPINEGVIFVSANHPKTVQSFFRNYLATYEALLENNDVVSHYGDIRKWRGGQLSLNAQVFNAEPFSPYREYTNNGIHFRFLPCDIFNYSFEYGDRLNKQDICNRYVIHLKGARKDAIEQINALLKLNKSNNENQNFITPHFALFNKMYLNPPLAFEETRKVFVQNLLNSANTLQANQENSGTFLADDSLVWFRNLGFLSDPKFINAFEPYVSDLVLKARIWRIYTLCWAAHSCSSLPGHFVDIGCYDGKTVDVISRYTNFSALKKHYFLYDIFDEPPTESRKTGHGPMLFDQVKSLFSTDICFNIIKGSLPESFSQGLPDEIAFAQIDLNAAEPELSCLEILFDRMTPGGIIVLDDFGFLRYRETHIKETEFFAKRSHLVFEIPTGQGLVIKRG